MASSYTFKSSGGETLEVSEATARKSGMIKKMIDDGCAANDAILLPDNVTSKAIAKVNEYCQKHVDEEEERSGGGNTLKEWDGKFVKELSPREMLMEVLLAAHYLDIMELVDVTCRQVARTMEGMGKTFHITNGYTKEEEEEEVRRQYRWAFD